jgi:hypothetical protein
MLVGLLVGAAKVVTGPIAASTRAKQHGLKRKIMVSPSNSG